MIKVGLICVLTEEHDNQGFRYASKTYAVPQRQLDNSARLVLGRSCTISTVSLSSVKSMSVFARSYKIPAALEG